MSIKSGRELLKGIRIIELGQVIAAPTTAALLSDFGANVIKIENPSAPDGARDWEPSKNGVSLWWKVLGRNKHCITLNLKHPRGSELFTQLVERADVLVENYRAGVLERLGFGPERLHEINSRLVVLRVSGYGQTGPYHSKPGFGRAAEAFSGAQYLTGFPDRAPVHAGFSLADSVTGLMGAYAVMLALYDRLQHPDQPAQIIDLGLFESLYKLVDFPIPAYQQLGRISERNGNRHPGIAPINCYQTADKVWVTVSCATDPVAKRFLRAIGGEELATDERFITPQKRLKNVEALDAIIEEWFHQRTLEEIVTVLDSNDVVYSQVLNAADIWNDPQYRAREDIVEVPDDQLGRLALPGVVPKFSQAPGHIKWAGQAVGASNEVIYQKVLGLSTKELETLKEEGAI